MREKGKHGGPKLVLLYGSVRELGCMRYVHRLGLVVGHRMVAEHRATDTACVVLAYKWAWAERRMFSRQASRWQYVVFKHCHIGRRAMSARLAHARLVFTERHAFSVHMLLGQQICFLDTNRTLVRSLLVILVAYDPAQPAERPCMHLLTMQEFPLRQLFLWYLTL